MADSTESDRRTGKLWAEARKKNSDYFESQVEAFYHAQGRKIISWERDEHHALFGKYNIPFNNEKLADFIVDDSPTSIILAEAKAKDIETAIEQLKNLAGYLRKIPPHRNKEIKFHIHFREGTEPGNLAPAANQDRSFFARPTMETVLKRPKYSLMEEATKKPVRIPLTKFELGNRVFVFIGPGNGTRS